MDPELKRMAMMDLDDVLSRLAAMSPRPARVVEMRFFEGLTEEQIAEVLGVSIRTVKRDWHFAKAWLYGELVDKDGKFDQSAIDATIARKRAEMAGKASQ